MFLGERRELVERLILADDDDERQAALDALLPLQRAGLRRDLRGDGRAAGHDPADRPAAARVPARPRGAVGRGRGRRGARRARRGHACGCWPRSAAARAEPDARPARRAAGPGHPGPVRDAGAGDRRGGGRAASRPAATRGRRSWSRWSARCRSWRRSARRPSGSSPRSPSGRACEVHGLIGTMIEVPRAALTAGRDRRGGRVLLLRHQRPDPDDLGLLPRRRRGRVLLPLPGAGHLRRLAVRVDRPRRRRPAGRRSPSRRAGRPGPDLKLGVCGEHGGDPDSVHFFHEVGLDYVSCSPFRVPVARLEAGRAALGGERAGS